MAPAKDLPKKFTENEIKRDKIVDEMYLPFRRWLSYVRKSLFFWLDLKG